MFGDEKEEGRMERQETWWKKERYNGAREVKQRHTCKIRARCINNISGSDGSAGW